MTAQDPDRLINDWLREELDAVPEPSRALQEAIDAASVTPQHLGRLAWLRQLLGLDTSSREHGHSDRPEVVLTPAGGGTGFDIGVGIVRREGALSLPVVLAILALAVALVGATAWFTLGPGRELLGGAPSEGTAVPEQPLRPLDSPAQDRVIMVAPEGGHFRTVAGAIAAAQAGDRIELHPGTYQVEAIIDRDITIAGVGARESIIVEPFPLPAGVAAADQRRDVLTLLASDATLRGFILRGSNHGTAVVIDGGSPTLDDMVIDPDGDMLTGGPNQPREAITATGGASPTIRSSVLTSLAGFSDGATPLLDGVSFQGGCVLIEGTATAPVIRDSEFVRSECPGFSISVSDGASVLIEAAQIQSLAQNSGLRVANEGSSAEITGSTIIGGGLGIYAGDGASVVARRTNVREADVGIRVLGADLTLQDGMLIGNGTGLEVAGDSFLETTRTDICENEQNLLLKDDARVPFDLNQVCTDGTTELIVEDGS